MAKSHSKLIFFCLMVLAWTTASAQQQIPVPDQTPAPNPGVVPQIPVNKAPPLAAPTTAAPSLQGAPPALAARPAPVGPRVLLRRYADDLAILLLNLGAYNDPSAEQKSRLLLALGQLKAIAPNVQPLLTVNAPDPIMQFISFDLGRQFLRLEAAINAGTYSYARYLLRQVTQYTIPWRPGDQEQAPGLLQFPEPPVGLSSLERAEYLAAIKRYEDSMLAYEHVLSDKLFHQTQADVWEKAIENLMAISIRVRSSGSMVLEITSALLEESHLNANQKEMLQTWRFSAKAWIAETSGKKAAKPDPLLESQRLYNKGLQLTSKGPGFGAIEFLRAMALLNELAQSHAAAPIKAKGFQLAGKSSEKVRNVFMWMHPDAYYEACIRVLPHSAEARECFKLMGSFQTQQKDVVFDRETLKQLAELTR